MSWVLVCHAVEEETRWREVFAGAASRRRDAGEREYRVLRDDRGRILHLSRWTSHADAQAFFTSAEIEEVRRVAGVRAPEFLYLDEIERGVL